MQNRVREVIAQAFQVPVEQVSADAGVGSIEKWDSLGHLELMLALESTFDVHISSQAMLDLQSVEAITAFLQRVKG